MAKRFGGVVAPIITPFDVDENLDVGAFRAVVEYLVASGLDGLLVTGTTGEAFALSFEERRPLWEAAVKQAAGRAFILAGTGATSTREAERLTALAADCGCDAAVVLTPWFRPVSPETLERYYADLAESARLPLLFYHNPPRTHLDWPTDHIAKLAHKLAGPVVGIKDSAHDPKRVAALRASAPPGFVIFSGQPHMGAQFKAAGADGTIEALINALPAEAIAAWAGDAEKAAFYRSVFEPLVAGPDLIAALKALMRALGLPAGPARRPGDSFDPARLDMVRQAVAKGGRMAAGAANGAAAAAGGQPSTQPVHLLEGGAVAKCVNGPGGNATIQPVYVAAEGDYQYSHHAAIARFGGRFFVAWSNGLINEDSPGQTIRYATSDDGKNWSRPAEALPPLTAGGRAAGCATSTAGDSRAPVAGGPRWTCGGFWVRGEELYLLACRYTRARYVDGEATPGVCWEGLAAEALRWDGSAWRPAGALLGDFYPNEAPRQLPDGQWLWPGVDSRHDAVVAIGGGADIRTWRRVTLASRREGWRLAEPSWYLAGDGAVRVLLRDDGGSRRLFVCESRDGGNSWSPPVPTDFTDAQSKFRAMNLPDGRACVVGNPAGDDLRRKMLAVATSSDGRLFGRLIKVEQDAAASPRLAGMHKAAGFQYPNAIAADGRLWIAYSANKEDIRVASIALEELGG